ncbi:Uncharacterized protein SCF082_LOCUS39709, partial [Durusdinium trenchii]
EARGNTTSWTAKLASYRGKNYSRDFWRNQNLPLEPSRINVPVKMSDGSSSLEELPLQLPHHILEYLFNTCKLEIEKQSVLDYWNHLDSVGHSFAKSSKEFREARGSHEQAKDIEDAGAMYLKLFYRLNHMTMRTFISVSLLLFEPPSFSNAFAHVLTEGVRQHRRMAL